MENPILEPPIPYIGPIHGERFTPGKMVKIHGIAPATAYRFDINLHCGSGSTSRDDVAVQVSVRILEGFIAVNSMQSGVWGDEQHGLAIVMPIRRADKFEITILCDFSHYKVAVNGQHYCEFPQRIHYDRITHLAIDGDVSITQILYGSSAGGGPPTAPTVPGPIPFPLVDNDTDDFQIINAKRPTGFAQPPPYGISMPDNQRAPSPAALYPVLSPYLDDVPAIPGSPSPPPDTLISLTAIEAKLKAAKILREKCVCYTVTAVIMTLILVVSFSAVFTGHKGPTTK